MLIGGKILIQTRDFSRLPRQPFTGRQCTAMRPSLRKKGLEGNGYQQKWYCLFNSKITVHSMDYCAHYGVSLGSHLKSLDGHCICETSTTPASWYILTNSESGDSRSLGLRNIRPFTN